MAGQSDHDIDPASIWRVFKRITNEIVSKRHAFITMVFKILYLCKVLQSLSLKGKNVETCIIFFAKKY